METFLFFLQMLCHFQENVQKTRVSQSRASLEVAIARFSSQCTEALSEVHKEGLRRI